MVLNISAFSELNKLRRLKTRNLQSHINISTQQMKGATMNLKLRFKNKATLVALASALIAFIYQILGILGITAPIAQDEVSQLVGIILNILVAVGVLVDPTTKGIGDSELAKNKTDIAEVIEYKED
nr:MAG TPA: holin [Caudoviricetes sp.]